MSHLINVSYDRFIIVHYHIDILYIKYYTCGVLIHIRINTFFSDTCMRHVTLVLNDNSLMFHH